MSRLPIPPLDGAAPSALLSLSRASAALTRREFLLLAPALAAGACGVTAAAITGPTEPATVRCTLVPVAAPAAAPGFAGCRIGFVSDVHLCPWTPRPVVEHAARLLTAAAVDLLLLGGDYLTVRFARPTPDAGHRVLREVMAIFGAVPAPLGRFAVMGNHEAVLHTPAAFRTALQGSGVIPLVDEAVRLERHGSMLHLAGLRDSVTGTPRVERAVADRGDAPVLLLTHAPDVLPAMVAPLVRPWLTLAGHLHGGQVRVPVRGPLIRHTRYPAWYDAGWARGGPAPVYVSRGLGTVGVPLRVGCPPEVVVLDVG